MNDIENVKGFCKGYLKCVQEELSKFYPGQFEKQTTYTSYAEGLETTMKHVIEFIEKMQQDEV